MNPLGEGPDTDARFDPRRYHELVTAKRTEIAQRPPVCLYLEVTNRCNLLCTTCPRTYEELEPPADMSWDLFTSIVDQVPDLARAVLHGVGEPMLVANLPRMVRYLKDRSVYVLFNTNGTVLNERNGRALIDAGLDELRVSLDASNRESFKADPWQGLFRPHSSQCARVSRAAGAGRTHQTAGFCLAHWPERDCRATPRICESGSGDRCQGGLSATARILRLNPLLAWHGRIRPCSSA